MSASPENRGVFEPFEIGRRFRIVQAGEQEDDDKLDIVMQRGAFGSGEHETTVSCLEMIEQLDLQGKRVLDLGSGTGILGIAASLCGARDILCVDIDPDAVANARENCRLNKIGEGTVRHLAGTLDDVQENRFDIVLANIYGDILIDLCNDLVEKVNPDGTLLLSGILWEYNFDVRNLYEQASCEVTKNRLMDEFSTILLTKS